MRRDEVARRLSLYYSEQFSGHVTSCFDESKRAYAIHGSRLPSHPSCPRSTWTMVDYVAPSKARELITGKSDDELRIIARVKAAEVRAEADRVIEGPDHPWRKERERMAMISA